MYKQIAILSAALMLSSCSYLHIHKQEIVQGNVMTDSQTAQLKRGMSEEEVKAIMGEPMLANIFSPDRIEYVYTIQPGGGTMSEKRVTCLFRDGDLVDIQRG